MNDGSKLQARNANSFLNYFHPPPAEDREIRKCGYTDLDVLLLSPTRKSIHGASDEPMKLGLGAVKAPTSKAP